MFPLSTRPESPGRSAETLTVRLLGDVVVRHDGEVVQAFASAKLRELLAFLVGHRDAPQPRERLACLLWPDSTDQQARTNLRKVLHTFRHEVPAAEACVEVTRRTLRWRHDAPATVDVVVFDDALSAAREARGDPASRDALERAVHAYGGDLLPECYDDWVLAERDRLRRQLVDALERLMAMAEADGDDEIALGLGRRLLRLEPTREATCRELMRLHARRGERARALRLYQACEEVLERELGVAPARATRAVYDALLGERTERTRPAADGLQHAPRLVGREQEWRRLCAIWEEAVAGRALAVIATGEAGVGKSRLIDELVGVVASTGVGVATSRVYEAEGRLAWGPVVDWLRSDAVRPALQAVATGWLAEVQRILPEVRGEHPDLPDPRPLDHAEQRGQLFRALAEVFRTAEAPLLLVVDDLQWCDTDTLEFVHFLLRTHRDRRLLVAGSARTGQVGSAHPLTVLTSSLRREGLVTELRLGPLAEEASAALAGEMLGRELEPAAARALYRATRGNPLFIVESVRAGMADDSPDLTPTLKAAIQARLRQLSESARAVAELMAVVGRECSFELLAEANGNEGYDLSRGLDELWRRRIVALHDHAFDFVHDRLRDVAYASISPVRLGRLHSAVARAMSMVYAEDLGPRSARLAVHYEMAGALGQAVAAHRAAADHALYVFAMDEALEQLERALRVLERLPAGPERDAVELRIRMAQGVPLVVRRGYGDPGVARVYKRALALASPLGSAPPPPALRGLAVTALVHRRYQEARRFGRQLLAAGEDDPVARVEGEYVLGVTADWMGDLATARRHLGRALDSYRPERRSLHLARFSQDPQPVCLVRLAWVQWRQGEPARAVTRAREARKLANALAHPLSRAYVDWFAAALAIDAGDRAWLEALNAAGAETWKVNALFYEPLAPLAKGWAEVLAGDARGLDRLRAATDANRQASQGLFLIFCLWLVARACLAFDRPDEATASVSEALEQTRRTGQRLLEAELERVAGEVAAATGDEDAARDAFCRALDVAAGQGARAYELRAAASWAHRDGGVESLARLRTVYDAFDEGLDTPDLRDAAALLAVTS